MTHRKAPDGGDLIVVVMVNMGGGMLSEMRGDVIQEILKGALFRLPVVRPECTECPVSRIARMNAEQIFQAAVATIRIAIKGIAFHVEEQVTFGRTWNTFKSARRRRSQ